MRQALLILALQICNFWSFAQKQVQSYKYAVRLIDLGEPKNLPLRALISDSGDTISVIQLINKAFDAETSSVNKTFRDTSVMSIFESVLSSDNRSVVYLFERWEFSQPDRRMINLIKGIGVNRNNILDKDVKDILWISEEDLKKIGHYSLVIDGTQISLLDYFLKRHFSSQLIKVDRQWNPSE